MKDKKKDELEQSFISKLLSGLSEDMLKRLVLSVIFAVPSIRRWFIKTMSITFLLGALTALALVYALFDGVPGIQPPSDIIPIEKVADE